MKGTDLLKDEYQERYSVGDQKEGECSSDDCSHNRQEHLKEDVLEALEESHLRHIAEPLGDPGVIRCCESEEARYCFIGDLVSRPAD